ncbi:hypothetical protein MUK42_13727 [Musa troglodytarum]|uniref:Uncharacterized protein n=1 Tax=Musa troglodytarum TaxID=320322 RepID=A0A9E7IAN0_9LILI|nr:hypothetical protein MUK42_13727 [Musa troglodytarum]
MYSNSSASSSNIRNWLTHLVRTTNCYLSSPMCTVTYETAASHRTAGLSKTAYVSQIYD